MNKEMNINSSELYDTSYDFHITLSIEEKIKCLEEIISKLNKILYVYDKGQEPNSTYNYKVYCGGILIYVSSSNSLFNGELINIIVNINAIITNDFDKTQLKRVVFESKNYAKFLLDKYRRIRKKEKKKYNSDNNSDTFNNFDDNNLNYIKQTTKYNSSAHRQNNFNGKVGN